MRSPRSLTRQVRASLRALPPALHRPTLFAPSVVRDHFLRTPSSLLPRAHLSSLAGVTNNGDCYTTPVSGAVANHPTVPLAICRAQKCRDSNEACGGPVNMLVYSRTAPYVIPASKLTSNPDYACSSSFLFLFSRPPPFPSKVPCSPPSLHSRPSSFRLCTDAPSFYVQTKVASRTRSELALSSTTSIRRPGLFSRAWLRLGRPSGMLDSSMGANAVSDCPSHSFLLSFLFY
jgi:hypothetical protein